MPFHVGKSWPFRKTKNDHEAGSSRGHKKERNRRYVPVDYAHELYNAGRPVPWSDVNLPGSSLLNSWRVPVPPVPREGRKRRDEIRRRRFILPPDLQEDPAYALDNYNWDTFGSWEFDPRRRAGYLGDVAYLNALLGRVLFDNNGDEDEDEEEDEEEVLFDNNANVGGQPDLPIINPEVQPPEVTEEEAIELVVA